ncbi:Hypothetical protein Minf_0350 [Methylacidiphilum infernorum V4]|uniref:Uncharacterized protein n=1 Tax=Methylacidiphilum infernorum (isolate V4) TaxID=481448 RepID=B3DYD1_METI4|nr:Hypothetical protein Minf_0350 [Methylacidiphilum infernorum V4]
MFFVDEAELESVLQGKAQSGDQEIALVCYRTASFVFGLAYQNYKMGEFTFNHALVRQLNKSITGGLRRLQEKGADNSGSKDNSSKRSIRQGMDGRFHGLDYGRD